MRPTRRAPGRGSAWRLAVGTLSAVPVRPPEDVDPRVARDALLWAPLAVLPLGVLVGVVLRGGALLGLPALGVGVVAVGALALGSRAFHLDGLSDTVDGLTSSYDPERALAVMKSGTSGPAGTVALVVVLGAQAAALGALSASSRGAVAAGLLVCLSRCALLLTCVRGVPGARADGLGTVFVGCVPRSVAAVGWLLVAVWCAVAAHLLHDSGGYVQGVVAAVVAGLVVGVLVRRAVRRFGGVTGDVYGAAIEVALTVLLLGLSA